MTRNENARLAESFDGGQQIGLNIEGQHDCVQPSDNDYTSADVGIAEQSDDGFMVTLDHVPYATKPQGSEYCAITKRLQLAGSSVCTPAEFCEHVKRGMSWVGAVCEPSPKGWGEFVGQQLFGLDFDNAASSNGAKVPLKIGEKGFLDPVDALVRFEDMGIDLLCLYFTMSARCPDWPRFRVVLDAGMLADEETARAIIEELLGMFPEADQACRNPNRIFLGSQGEVWECWKAMGGCDG